MQGCCTIGEELIIDIKRYEKHPDAETLFCFVYDPEGRIENPRGLEESLNCEPEKGLKVKVMIVPTEG